MYICSANDKLLTAALICAMCRVSNEIKRFIFVANNDICYRSSSIDNADMYRAPFNAPEYMSIVSANKSCKIESVKLAHLRGHLLLRSRRDEIAIFVVFTAFRKLRFSSDRC